MAQSFDPYLQWLGIRDPQRPPNHYRLLGLELFESDADVIAGAADRQMAHVRSFQSGQHSELSQKILNELASARVCLLKPDRKTPYDAALRKQIAARAVAVSKPPTGSPAAIRVTPDKAVAVAPAAPPSESSVAMAEIASLANMTSSTSARSRSRQRKAQKKSPLPLLAVAVLALVVIAAVAYSLRDTSQPVAQLPNRVGSASADPTSNVPLQSTNDPTIKPATDPITPQNATANPKTKPVQPADEPKPTPATTESPAEEPTSVQPAEMTEDEKSSSEEGETPSVDDLATDTEDESTEEPSEEPFEQFPEDDEPTPPAVAASPVDKRLPVPEKAAQDASLEIIKDLFKAEFTARKPEERAAFAQKLLAQGRDTGDDPTSAYVLFDQALNIAASVGDVETAINSADRLAELYQIDGLEIQATTLGTLARTARTPQLLQAVANQAVSMTELAIEQDRFDYAKRFNALALAAARKTKDLDLINQSQARLRDIKLLESEYTKIESAIIKLKEFPNDPEANLAVGQYLCFAKADFKNGLPHLANSKDAKLKKLAQDDLAKPIDPSEQVALADRWWELGDQMKAPENEVIEGRAVCWYREALPNLTGLAKATVDMKLQNFSAHTSPARNALKSAAIIQELVGGPWRIEYRFLTGTRVVSREYRFNRDGTFVRNDIYHGRWMLRGTTLVLKFDNLQNQFDEIEVKGGEMRGRGFNSQEIQLTTISGFRIR